ncbi:unnamed protein product, partial [marine sediment metagenome]
NFGQQIAKTAGLDYCKGENVVLMDADLQDRPEEIPKLFAKLSEGYDIVYALPRKRRDSLFRKLTSKVYLSFLARLTGQAINPEIGSFQIITRRVVDYMNQLGERSPFFGGLVAWLGFPYALVDVEHERRFAGKSKYSLWKLIELATEGVISFSHIPLRLAGYFGLIVSAVSFALGIYMLIRWFIGGIPVTGYTSIIVSLFFIGGVILVVLGVIGQYIGKIHTEVKQRPLYVIRDMIE